MGQKRSPDRGRLPRSDTSECEIGLGWLACAFGLQRLLLGGGLMIVKARLSALTDTKWHEYALRFGLGRFATAATGLIANKCGPVTGGLSLAFPAIFCASATLVEKHERERKQ